MKESEFCIMFTTLMMTMMKTTRLNLNVCRRTVHHALLYRMICR